MAKENVRKCDSCKFCMTDDKGSYCDNIMSTEYGLFSVYGWCESYEPDEALVEHHN